MDLGSAVIGFLGGGVAAWGLGLITTRLIMHPVISVRLDRESGCFGTVPLVNLETGKYLRDVEFIRLHVKNTGLSTIKDCCGYITKLAKRAEKEEEEVVPRQEIVDLGWAHHPQSTVRSIPRGAFFHMDVVSLNVMGERELRPPHLPTTLMEFFRGKGTYKAWILIAADNAKPREIVVEFACDPDHDELTPKEGNWENYPWWKPWVDQWLKPWWRWLRKPRLDGCAILGGNRGLIGCAILGGNHGDAEWALAVS